MRAQFAGVRSWTELLHLVYFIAEKSVGRMYTSSTL